MTDALNASPHADPPLRVAPPPQVADDHAPRAEDATRATRVIAITNQKGGVGKTTTSVNLSAALALSGARVLLIDLDPQANASSGYGISGDAYPATIYEALLGLQPIRAAIVETDVPGAQLVPSSRRLVGAELELAGMERREYRFRDAIQPLMGRYDFILVDCPPSLGLLTLNALTAIQSVLIPIQCEYYALEGLGSLMHTIQRVQRGLNPDLHIEGVLLSMYDARLNLARQVADETRRFFGDRVYRSVIPRNVKICEAPSFGQPVLLYEPRCIGAQSFLELAKEVLGHEQEGLGAGPGRPDSGREPGADDRPGDPDHGDPPGVHPAEPGTAAP